MPKKEKKGVPRVVVPLLWVAALGVFLFVLYRLGNAHLFQLFQTRGEIADKQRNLIVFTILLSLVVLAPTYFMLYFFAWRYREGHKHHYRPKWNSNILIETIWWVIPVVIIGILAVVTWNTSHSLDPFKPLASSRKPLQIQVVALNWKWLFIYPEQRVASVNEFAFPMDKPVELTLTSDGPMNSFWLPQLAGQIYVMSGMSTKLHINSSHEGAYQGVTANISGKGYADMRFTARAISGEAFDEWLIKVAGTGKNLDVPTLKSLRKESIKNPVAYYNLDQYSPYQSILEEYMSHTDTDTLYNHEAKSTEVPANTSHTTHTVDSFHMEGM